MLNKFYKAKLSLAKYFFHIMKEKKVQAFHFHADGLRVK